MRWNGFKSKASSVTKLSRLYLTDRFPDLIAQAGLSQRAFARQSGISSSTIMGLLHPELHPGRRGGMQRRTAWMLAQAYGELVHIDADAAFRLLIVERPEESTTDIAPSKGIVHDAS
jgi:transcriptional regulator with XRE-family HTH domain